MARRKHKKASTVRRKRLANLAKARRALKRKLRRRVRHRRMR